MTQINLSVKQKQTHRHREQTYGAIRKEGWGSLGLVDTNQYIYNRINK